MTMQAGQIEVNGIRVPYVDDGRGAPAVVFVHGAVGDLRVWEPIREAVADHHRFVALTLRYFGTDAWRDDGSRFSVATHAEDVAAFIEALGIGPVHLVGWSYGGNVVTAVALEHPDVVRSLILFEPAIASMVKKGAAGDAAREAQGRMFGPVTAAVEEGDAEKATVMLIEGVFQLPPGGFGGQPPEIRAIQLDNARTMPLLWSTDLGGVTCDMLGTLDKPTLIVVGAESNAYWPHIAEAMKEYLPDAEVTAQPGVNHDGPVRDPAGLAAIIRDFVAKH
jgi:pimeloyl-ACP methyl ester carboxylesterase